MAPVLPWVIAVVSITAIIQRRCIDQMSVEHRNLNQKPIILVELISQVTALVVMLALGLATRSIWALVAGFLVSALTTTLLSHFWMSGHANRFRVEKKAMQEFSSFRQVGLCIVGDRNAGRQRRPAAAGIFRKFPDPGPLLHSLRSSSGLSMAPSTDCLQPFPCPCLSATARSGRENLREAYYKIRVPLDSRCSSCVDC